LASNSLLPCDIRTDPSRCLIVESRRILNFDFDSIGPPATNPVIGFYPFHIGAISKGFDIGNLLNRQAIVVFYDILFLDHALQALLPT
jgi:hypothetical protein